MGISFRKRIGTGKAGRINVSKGGVGGSIGSKAGRFGVSSAGTPYVRGGSNGVYYRSEATNSSEPTSSSLTSKPMPSQTPSDLLDISANMPMDELMTAYNRIMRNFTSQIEQMSFRLGKHSVIEDYQHRYLVEVVHGAFNGGKRGSFTQSERAWTALANTFNERHSYLAPLQIVGERQQKLASLAEIRGLEACRSDFVSLAPDASMCVQAVRIWCAEFDDRWNNLIELGWLPRLGQP